jgi:GNAT superfamily N-acetyltransferase
VITSRLGSPGDIEFILDGAELMNAESDWGLSWSRDVGRHYLEWLITDPSADILLVERDGVPVGGAFVAASWEFHLQPLCYVCKFWVVKEHRRGDVSRTVVKDILEWASLKNCSHVFTTATAGLNRVEQMLFVRLFKSHGFDAVGPVLAAKLGAPPS